MTAVDAIRPASAPVFQRVRFASDIELILLSLHLIFVLFFSVMSDFWQGFGVITGSLLLAGILLFGAYLQIRQTRIMLWNLLVWFRMAAAGFFGFGNLVPYFANEATVSQLKRLYDFTNDQALTVLMITTMSCLITLSVARFFWIYVAVDWSFSLRKISKFHHLKIAVLFLILGGVARYGAVLPKHYGWIDGSIPGWLNAMSAAYAAGLFLLILWSLRYSKLTLVFSIALVLIDLAMGALAFDKSEVVLTIAFSYLAILYHRFSLTRAILGAGIVLAIIYYAQSPAHYGRYQIGSSGNEAASLGQRIGIVGQYITYGDDITRWSGGDLNPLMRISYLNVAAFVINEYESGRPGDAHINAFAAMVPRALWPNKPMVGAAGSRVYFMLRGRSGASVGVGHFAEAYWSFGMIGPLLIFLPGGIMLSIMAYLSVMVVRQERWLLLPVVLFGIAVGYKVSGSWVPTVVGGFATFLVLFGIFLTVEFLDRIMAGHSKPVVQ